MRCKEKVNLQVKDGSLIKICINMWKNSYGLGVLFLFFIIMVKVSKVNEAVSSILNSKDET